MDFAKRNAEVDLDTLVILSENGTLRLRDYRNQVIEECARKVDQMISVLTNRKYTEILEATAETIRALKDEQS